MSDSQKPSKRKQLIDFDDCERCGVGQLYQVNDADEGFFYDDDPVLCDNCGFEVGRTICDEDDCRVIFHEEIDAHQYDLAMTKHDQLMQQALAMRVALKTIAHGQLPDGDGVNMSTCMFAEQALEQFDEFMKRGEK